METFKVKSWLCLLLVSAVPLANADTLTWAGGASGSFSTGPWTSDGSRTTPENGDTLVFGTAGSFANDIASLSVAGLSITAAGNVEIGGSQITLVGGGSLSKSGSGIYTNNVPLVLGTAAGQTVNVDVATSCTLAMSACISGPADVIYNNGSISKGTVYLLADCDYTGVTTIKRGLFYVFANAAFGTTDGNTVVSAAEQGQARISFQDITTSENFLCTINCKVTNANCAGAYAFRFAGINVFNGTWQVSGAGFFYPDTDSSTTFNGTFTDSSTFYLSGKESSHLYFNGGGSSFKAEKIYAGNIHYGAKCKSSNMTIANSKDGESGWYNSKQNRYFECENAMLYDVINPAGINFTNRSGCRADMGGYDQTFSYISCPEAYSSCIVTSGAPSTVHLTLSAANSITNCAKAVGRVSYSFEGSQPYALGNAANTSTGPLSLTNAANVTLLDGFKWAGSSVMVADGSTITVDGAATFPADLVVEIADRKTADVVTTASKIHLDGNISSDRLVINGKTMSGGKSYGATVSGADVIDDDHFAGTGVLEVKNPCGLTIFVR